MMEPGGTLTERGTCPFCGAEVEVEFNKYDEGECPECDGYILSVNGEWQKDEVDEADDDEPYEGYADDDDDDEGW